LKAQLATLTQALSAAHGHGTPATNVGTDVECNYCHEKGHVVATCPKLAAKKAKESAPQTPSNTKHWTKVPPAEGEPLSRIVTADGQPILYKFCARCHRWRAREKGHTTEEHRTRAELSMATPSNQGNVGTVSNAGNLGLSFGLGGLFVGTLDFTSEDPLIGDTDDFLQDCTMRLLKN
jgi:hypothetical protein